MKKIILLGAFALFSIVSNAQLRVSSSGKVTITGLPSSTASSHYGLDVSVEHGSNSYFACAIKGYAGDGLTYNPFTSIGVCGAAESNPFTKNSVGIYGSSTNVIAFPSADGGVYAGYFYGDVRTTGTIYGTLLSPTSTSSTSNNETTSILSSTGEGESVTDKLQRVDLLQMSRMNQNGSLAANKSGEVASNINWVTKDNSSIDENLTGMEENIDAEPVQTKLSSISYGLAADQLKEVYPELVYEDIDGNYSVNYIEMVPLLVQSIKELSAKVATLEAELGIQDPTKPVLKAKQQIADNADDITLTVPDDVQHASLNIYDMNGRLICKKTVDTHERATFSSFIPDLPEGTYAYCLIVDGKKLKAQKFVVKN